MSSITLQLSSFREQVYRPFFKKGATYLSLARLKKVNLGAEILRIGINLAKSVDCMPKLDSDVVSVLKLPSLFSLLYYIRSAQRAMGRLRSDIGYMDYESILSSVLGLTEAISDSLSYSKSFYGAIKELSSFSEKFPLGASIVFITRLTLIAKILFGFKKVYELVSLKKEIGNIQTDDQASLNTFIEKQIGLDETDVSNPKCSAVLRKKEQAFIRKTNKVAFAKLKELQISVRSSQTAPISAKVTVRNLNKRVRKNLDKTICRLATDTLKLVALVFLAFSISIPIAYAFLLIRKVLNPIIKNTF